MQANGDSLRGIAFVWMSEFGLDKRKQKGPNTMKCRRRAALKKLLSLKLLKNVARKYHLTAIDLFGYPFQHPGFADLLTSCQSLRAL